MINTYNETDLHKQLKEFFCPKGGKTEQPLMGSICDILCKNGKVIEIQTSNLAALRVKLEKFLPLRNVEIIYPIPLKSVITVLNKDGNEIRRRKSPKKGSFFQIFKELSGIYHLFDSGKLKLKLVYIENEIIKAEKSASANDGKKRRGERPGIINKKLTKISDIEEFKSLSSICTPILKKIPEEFTNKDLIKIGAGKYASYTSWFFKKCGFIIPVGKKDRFTLYKKTL
ncbi:hypothetical protein [Treponema pedis]|uniref:DUF8091 domain-containing protein n=1 Tax=Treponema pedis str. T A4 TaxID=1291379 RepID=S5ZQR2_9SPIR|nr:hypothetical protein [Treponema pedis]AGT44997.1 hypothetical protein TPE_2525 [Treponema pedis str. T A4]